ncbi:hypothetical protein EYZ11_007816 [Aspergillus tanneri]|uniref:Uncharacterized protein n=1 Tax=Aspergillus tanneri TaxID=1220188 RepID=A0A4S3JC19_9EURO|nr:hypothetical protein EYZ11_007816 [Aspergillus tanneri]
MVRHQGARQSLTPRIQRYPEDLQRDVEHFYRNHDGLEDVVDVKLLLKGARVAHDPNNLFLADLTGLERKILDEEDKSGLFNQTKELKVTILTTTCAAITQYENHQSIRVHL